MMPFCKHLSKLESTRQTRGVGLWSASIIYFLLQFNQLALKEVDCSFEQFYLLSSFFNKVQDVVTEILWVVHISTIHLEELL